MMVRLDCKPLLGGVSDVLCHGHDFGFARDRGAISTRVYSVGLLGAKTEIPVEILEGFGSGLSVVNSAHEEKGCRQSKLRPTRRAQSARRANRRIVFSSC